MGKRIIPPTLLGVVAFRDSVRSLLALGVGQLTQLRAAAEGESGFGPSDDLIHLLRTASGIGEKDGVTILSLCSFLYDQITEPRDADALIGELADMAEELGIADFGSKEQALRVLFQPIAQYDRLRQRTQVTEAAIPVLESLSLYFDMRAVPSKAEPEIEGYVPVVLARLRFDESIAGQEAIFFQITEETLARVASEVERVRKLVEAAKLDLRDRLY